MKKLEMKTIDGVQENLSKIEQLFPTVITESMDEKGNIVKAVDFERLKQELSTVVSTGKETYEFRWVGKDNAIVEANTKTDKALRPCKEESKNWDKTENLYIEGDNLDVLKILKNSYKNQVKMIYIDPPYNTGDDSFIYPDDYSQNKDEYDEKTGVVDEKGYRLIENTITNGRFHSDWCSMMYPRLKVARDLLTEDGVIFISIDDHESDNLRKICDEVFGAGNFIAQIIWERAYSPVNLKKHFSECHDYILCYSKNKNLTICNGLPRSQEANERYSNPDNDPRGVWKSSDLSVGPIVQSKVYEITTPSGRKVLPPNGYCWRLDKETFEKYLKDNRIWFGETGNNVPSIKRFLSEVKQGMTPMTIWKYTEVGHSQDAAQKLKQLFDGKALFDYPKSVELLKRCCVLYSDKDSIILDFFSGSATTAHAVMQLNAEDDGNRKFIMVQLPEICKEETEAYKAGYKNICEIGKERIRRAGEKIIKKTGKTGLDIGFRVYKLDSGNYEQVFKAPGDLKQSDLGNAIETIKRDRTDEDLLFGTLLAWGADTCLSMSYDVVLVGKYKIYVVKNGAVPELVACFDEDVNDDGIKKMAEYKPMRVAFRERGLKTVERRANAENLLKQLHPLLEENDIRLI